MRSFGLLHETNDIWNNAKKRFSALLILSLNCDDVLKLNLVSVPVCKCTRIPHQPVSPAAKQTTVQVTCPTNFSKCRKIDRPVSNPLNIV
jgi:hypothetical protein